MRIRRGALASALAFALVAAVSGSVGAEVRNAPSQGQSAAPGPRLQMYEATVDAATANRLADEGYEIVLTEQVRGGVRIVLVLYPTERKAIEKQGIDLTLWTNSEGVTATDLAKQQKDAGFKVFQDYDGPDGIRAYLAQIAAANPGLLKLEVIGQTYGTDPEGDGPDTPRDIVALKLTANANTVPDNSRPAALYTSLQHAREWISVEVNQRLLEWLIKM